MYEHCQENPFEIYQLQNKWVVVTFILYWSERRCADAFVESAVGHYFWYFIPLLFFFLPPLLNWHKGLS